MGEPIEGQHYRAKGFEFRVDQVKDGQVYCVRWPLPIPEDKMGYAMRVPLDVWRLQMAHAELISV